MDMVFEYCFQLHHLCASDFEPIQNIHYVKKLNVDGPGLENVSENNWLGPGNVLIRMGCTEGDYFDRFIFPVEPEAKPSMLGMA